MGKRRIAVLGGGLATMSAVFELTDRPGWEDELEIDVYQMGWRLGGKGASGRNRSDVHGIRHRIEEHGLHIWFGFYENAFRQIRRCYERVARPATHPIPTWREAFTPQDTVLTHEWYGGRWLPWEVRFPVNDELPGQGDPFPDLGDLISMIGQWLLEAVRGLVDDDDNPVHATDDALAAAEVVRRAAVEKPVKPEEVEDEGFFARAIDTIEGWVRGWRDALLANTDARRSYIVIDLLGATLRGLATDQVLRRGFDHLDDIDFREWLRKHGASDFTLTSAFMNGTYDTVFGFLGGDPEREVLAAGTGLRSGLRMLLAYKGHFMWKMNAGMGDIVFAPYYEILRRRGVRFHFFHRVEALRLGADQTTIDAIDIRVQATPVSGTYEPLVMVHDLECWPSEPLYDQLVEGETLRGRAAAGENVNLESYWSAWEGIGEIQLRHGADYDHVLLGIPVAALGTLCSELVAARPEWRDMVENIATNRTMNAQLWLRPDVQGLGWDVCRDPILGGFVRPLSVWADLSHLLTMEDWSGCAVRPAHLAYLVGPMRDSAAPEPPYFTDPTFPRREEEQVYRETKRFLEEHAQHLWPQACRADGCLDWDLLVDPLGRSGPQRLEAQYLRGNVDPNERYTLSVAGSTRYRLRADQSGFSNLTLTGDWTYNGLNAGCVEAAVMSGMQASRAIAGYPQEIVAEDDVPKLFG